MEKWLSKSEEEKQKIFNEAALQLGIHNHNVEKDWWVVQTLRLVFQMEVGAHLVFKGGTSLSKSWGVINRFSEDVDLAIDRKFLGFEGDLNKNQRTKLRKASSSFIIENFVPDLQSAFKNAGFKGVKVSAVPTTESDQDPKLVEIYYPAVFDYPHYIKPRILLEIGCRSLMEPFSMRTIRSFLDQSFPKAPFVLPEFMVPSVNMERTFLEKIFLLHEEFQKSQSRSERMSRHLYDLFKLSEKIDVGSVLQNKELYQTIVAHRKQFTKIAGIDYDKHSPEFIEFLPSGELLNAYKKDYTYMIEHMINEEAPNFTILIAQLEKINKALNAIKF